MGVCRRLNINDKNEINMMAKYEQKHNLRNSVTRILNIKSQEEQGHLKNEQDFDFIEIHNLEIINHCHIHYEKDIKLAKISFDDISNQDDKSGLVASATKYVLHTLGLEKAVVYADPNNTQLMKQLLKCKYEDLGEYEGSIIFMKEKVNAKGQMTDEITK